MPRKALQGVKSGFDELPDGKWFPVSIAEAKTRFGKPGTKWANVLQLSLVYSTAEEMHGVKAGRKVFDGGALEGEFAGITRARLEEIRPDIDWGEFEFPEPSESQAELEELLVGQDGYVLTKRSKDGKYTNIAKYTQDEPAELSGADDEDDEDYDDLVDEDEDDDDDTDK